MNWLQIKKKKKKKPRHFEVLSSLILHDNNEQFLDQILTCIQKWILHSSQWWPAQWLDWEEAPKHFPKPNLHQKRVIVTVWWSAAGLIRYGFLNPGETIISEKYTQQIDEMHWNLQHLQPDLVNRKGPVFLCDFAGLHVTPPGLPKLNKSGYQVLHHQPYSPDLLPTDYNLLKHVNNVLQGKCFHNQQEVENAFQEFTESWSMDFYITEIHKLISHWKKCIDCNGFCFD